MFVFPPRISTSVLEFPPQAPISQLNFLLVEPTNLPRISISVLDFLLLWSTILLLSPKSWHHLIPFRFLSLLPTFQSALFIEVLASLSLLAFF